MADLSHRRAQLMQRLDDLDHRLHEIDHDLRIRPSEDWEDRATEREDDEVLERLGISGQAEIQRIKAALARIDEGEYGYCVRCGAEISAERLDLVPQTPLCRTCARAN